MGRAAFRNELRGEIEDLYARQMHALDTGRYGDFAETLAEDCEFTPVKNQPTCYGRQAIAKSLTDFARTLAGSDEQRRHWMSMCLIDEVAPDAYEVVSYTMVTSARPGQPPVLHWAGDTADLLIRVAGELRVQRREVRSDSIA